MLFTKISSIQTHHYFIRSISLSQSLLCLLLMHSSAIAHEEVRPTKENPKVLADSSVPSLKKVRVRVAKRTENALPIIMDMVHSNPGELKTISRFNNHKELKRWGFNAQAAHLQVQCGITLDSFEEGIVPKGSKERQWIEEHANWAHDYIKKGKKSGVLMIPFTDIMVVPKQVYDKYKNESGNLNITKEVTQRMLRCWIDEIFTRYPELDGLTLRFGETYLHDTPFHRGKSPVRGLDQHVQLLKVLREEICLKRNKYLIYRTWGWDGFHTNADYFKKATDQIETHPKLIFSIKHTKGDFLRRFPFNPTLGVGKHKFIVEVQNQREYEGKGAYPNYVAKSVLDGFEEETHKGKYRCVRDLLKNKNFSGVFNWTRGGGWRGPYIKNEIWIMLNAYVISRWANDPSRSEEDIFNEFSKDVLNLNKADAEIFHEIALLSTNAVLRGQYSVSYPISSMWNRDQYYKSNPRAIKWGIDNNRYEEVLKEKGEAVAIWQKIVVLSQKLNIPNQKMSEAIKVSCRYGYYKHAVIEKAWTVIALGKAGDKTKTYDKARMTQAAKDYFLLWKKWEQLRERYPNSCATLYEKNGCKYYHQEGMFSTADGMENAMRKYIKKLKLDIDIPPVPSIPIPRVPKNKHS